MKEQKKLYTVSKVIDFIFMIIIDMEEGSIGDMSELGITESLRCKRQMLMSAAEAAEMILRVDDIIKATPRRREPDHGH